MKRQILEPIAERMYVVDQMTLNTISTDLKLAEKTVWSWKQDGNWDVKRDQYLKTKTDFHADLYNFARKLMKLIDMDMERMIESPLVGDEERDKRLESRINSMSRLLDKLPKTKDYESKIKNEAEAENRADVSGDAIAQKVKEILGG
jgi:hypothetical protein